MRTRLQEITEMLKQTKTNSWTYYKHNFVPNKLTNIKKKELDEHYKKVWGSKVWGEIIELTLHAELWHQGIKYIRP